LTKIKKVILLVETSRASGRGILRGIAKYAQLHGPWEFLQNPPFYFRQDKERKELDKLAQWGADGIVAREPQKITKLISTGVPCIIALNMQNNIYDLPMMIDNFDAIGKMAAEHLLNRGFQHFAFCGFENVIWSVTRRQSFVRYLAEAGHQTHIFDSPLSRIRKSWEKEKSLLSVWLKALPKPIGIMSCNDERSQQLLETCKAMNILVPEEIALLGVDNDEMICDLSNPPLSSIALNDERAGYEVAELLDELMSGTRMKNQRIIVQPSHVVTRQSTDVMAIEDRNIAEAINFINKNARKAIQVNDVVEATTTSRRSLERRFQMVFKRSIYNEIRRARTEQIVRMLMETNKSILHIALSLGYPGVEQLDRYFRQEKGMSPMAYRKKYGHK
jgi:LacI family transcriptional regulator